MGLLRRIVRRLSGRPPSELELADARDNLAISKLVSRHLVSDTTVIDVGAHEGLFLDAVKRQAPGGRHLAFEPLPTFAARLRRRHPDIEVFELALSDAAGTATFHHVTTNPGYSGLRQRRLDRPHENVVTLTVATARLDDVVPPTVACGLIKIDVEGAELQVLRGARATLARTRPYVLFEHGQGGAPAYATQPEDVFDLLTELHYTIHSLEDGPPYDRATFRAEYDGGRRWNFWARPARSKI